MTRRTQAEWDAWGASRGVVFAPGWDRGGHFTNRVADFPERIPLVPPTLADFECGHGYISGCPVCDRERDEARMAEAGDRL